MITSYFTAVPVPLISDSQGIRPGPVNRALSLQLAVD